MAAVDKQGVASALLALKDVVQSCGQPQAYAALSSWAASAGYPELAHLSGEAVRRLYEVEADFDRLCIGPYRLVVPPYESVWRSGGRVLNNRFSAAVAHSFAEAGLAAGGKLQELPDYFGNELEFLYCLSALSLHYRKSGDGEAADSLDEMFSRFWAEHLGHWAPDFLEAIAREAEEPLWKEWALVLRRVLGEVFKDTPLSEGMTGLQEAPVAPPAPRQYKKEQS